VAPPFFFLRDLAEPAGYMFAIPAFRRGMPASVCQRSKSPLSVLDNPDTARRYFSEKSPERLLMIVLLLRYHWKSQTDSQYHRFAHAFRFIESSA
jgi:hypothetical protein